MIQQDELERTFQGIGAFQLELDSTLETLEKNVDDLFMAQSHLTPQDADVERERAYETASNIDTSLNILSQDLKQTLQQMDVAQERVFGSHGQAGDVGRIVHILNTHQNRLGELEALGRKMDADISQLNKALSHR
jgi:nuclear pore complex protein Nup62